jgi:hypothetical protein
MFNMGAETMKLPMEEKLQFEQGDAGNSFGFVSMQPIFSAHVPLIHIV